MTEQPEERTFYKFTLEDSWLETPFEDLKKGDIFTQSDDPRSTFIAEEDAEPRSWLGVYPARVKSHLVVFTLGEGLQ
jgi:hypothetical protein